jgi:hypothetical protein
LVEPETEKTITNALTTLDNVLQSTTVEIKTPGQFEQNMKKEDTVEIFEPLNADKIIEKISANKPIMRYDRRREWNGYKH